MSELKKTALHSKHLEAGAKMVPFAGYEMPLQYDKIVDEHLQVRKSAGLFDVSHMARFRAKGKGALDFCQKMTVNNVRKLKNGCGHYSVLCLPSGGALDDLTVFREAEDNYFLVVNASRRDVVWKWFQENKQEDFDLTDRTDTTALLAIQGPKSIKLLNEHATEDLSEMKFFSFCHSKLFGIDVTLCRCGYTGEPGFEIECSAGDAPKLWDHLLALGAPEDVKPIGLGARDTLRLEMGYMLYGNDLDENTSPLEAGLSWVVKLDDSDDFVGKPVLVEQKLQGLKKRLIGLKGDRRSIPRAGQQVKLNEKEVGVVSSGGFSPSLECGIGLAYIDGACYKQKPEKIKLVAGKRSFDVDVVMPPFIKVGK